jgi:hypothetical protein
LNSIVSSALAAVQMWVGAGQRSMRRSCALIAPPHGSRNPEESTQTHMPARIAPA